MKKLKRLSERCLALFTALVMCMSLVQATAFAGDLGTVSDEPPEHTCGIEEHTHSDTCYKLVCGLDETEATEGSDCTHEHDDLCSYAEEQAEVLCTCSDEDGDGEIDHTDGCGYQPAVTGSPCTHEHDGGCGYAEAVEGHTHTEACKELTCSQAEHTHTDACLAKKDEPKCICETKCGEGSVKEDCPVCGAENADLTACEGEEVPAEVPAQVQAFLDAVAALPALEDIPEEATEAEYEELRVLVEACQDAYDALTYEDMDREDVMAAIETMGAVIEAFCGIQTLEENGTGITWDAETKTLTAIGNGTETLTEKMLIETVGENYRDEVVTLIVDGLSIEKQLFYRPRTTQGGNEVKHPSSLRSVQLSNVKEIGSVAFQDSDKLTDFTLNSSDRVIIQSGAFADTGLQGELTLSNAEIKMNAFVRCNALTKVTLSNCDVTGYTAFANTLTLTAFSMTGGRLTTGQILDWTPKLSSIELTNVHVERVPDGSGYWYPLQGTNMGTEAEKLTVTINGGELTQGCLNHTVADELILNDVEIPDNTWPFYGTNYAYRNPYPLIKSEAKLTVNGGSIGSYGLQWVGFETIELNNVSSVGNGGLACNSTTLKTLILKNTNIDGTYPLYDWREGVRGDTLTVVAESDNCYLGTNAFWGAVYPNVILRNINKVGTYAFYQNTALTSVTFDNTDGKKTSIGDATTSCYSFQDCTALTTLNGIEHLSLVGGRAFEGCTNLSQDFITDLANSDVILGYSSIFKGNAAMEARMKGILGGRFNLDLVPEAEELKPEGWTSNKTGEKNSTEPDSNQITKEAKWHDADKTVADVQLQFSHSDKPGMDFLFILDLSDSMARIGNGDKDSDSRYYSMQSKMLDVVSKIVEADKAPDEKQYSNQVAFVTFGGYVNDSNVCHIDSTNGFTDDPSVVAQFDGLEALSQNTDYVAAFTEAQELVDSHDSSRKLAVIFISDGRPTREGTTNLNTVPLINSTIEKTANIAEGFEAKNVEVFGVLQSVPNKELKYAEDAMKAICTDGLYFNATDTQEFSDAVNKAIGAAYGTYTIVDTVGDDFDLDKSSIKCSENTEYEVSEDGKTITWTIYGLPFTTYTLSFQEKLHDDLVNHVGMHTYDTNKGVATVNEDVNTVETPQLERTVNQPDPNRYTVTVNYYLAGTTTPVPGTSPHTERLTEGASYNVTAYDRISVPGYTYSSTEGDLTGIMDGNKVINVYYTRTTPTPGPDPDPDPTPVTPRPTPIPDNPTPLNPGPDGTTIPDQDVPLAAPGLNSVDHYAYIIGYPDGLVHPEANVTRAEVATIFFRLMTDEFRTEHWATENAFLDVAAQEWFNNSVSTSSRAGIVKGYEDGSFRPNNNITRAEFAAIAARFLSDEVNISSSFSDISGHWAEEEINRAVMAGWIKGYTDGTFRPNQPITRAEAVTMINRMLDRTPDKDHMLENMIRWDDNTEDKWYYADMQEATNSHDYERLEMVLIEDWTELLENRDWAALQEEWATAASAPGGEVADNLDLSKTGENDLAQGAETAGTENA